MKDSNNHVHPNTFEDSEGNVFTAPGITKRELFAAMFLQGLLANPNLLKDDLKDQTMFELLAGIADLLLKHLEGSGNEKTR